MKQKIKRFLISDTNIPLLLLAVVLSFILWFIVVNVDDPSRTKVFTTTVKLENTEVLTQQGKYYTLKNDDTVSFRVTAKRSVMENLKATDFTAVADMNNLEDNCRIPVYITADKYANQVTISSQTYYLEVEIGDISENQFDVEVETVGDLADGYAVSDVSVNPESVVVNGPDNVVKTIAQIKAEVDVSGLSEDTTKTVSLQPYDSSGNLIDTSKLSFNVNKVSVDIKVDLVKTVTINVVTSGSLADGLKLDSVKATPAKVKIIGDADTLNSINSITIPGSVINLSEVEDSFTTTVSITSYLPNGVKLLDSDNSTIKIKVVITKASDSDATSVDNNDTRDVDSIDEDNSSTTDTSQ